MYLKEINNFYKKSQYGEIGTDGQLGYDGHLISVQERYYENSISAHPPSILIYDLNEEFNNITCEVGLNDTSHPDASADFYIYADNNLVACCYNVVANEKPRKINTNINYCKKLRLEIKTSNPVFAHAIWLDPIVSVSNNLIVGSMGEIYIDNPQTDNHYEICVATCISPEYIKFAIPFLESFKINSNLNSYKIILFTLDINEEIIKIAEDYKCLIVNCKFANNKGFFFKTAMYSVAKIIDADKYLLIDIDTVVQKPINQVFDNMNSMSRNSILITREEQVHYNKSIGAAITTNEWPYFGLKEDAILLRLKDKDFNFRFVCNGGVIFGFKESILALEDMIRSFMPHSKQWESLNTNIFWREQGILNLAISRMNSVLSLDKSYNYQLLHRGIEDSGDAHILHFNGENGKKQFNKFKLKKYKTSEFTNQDIDILFNRFNYLHSNSFQIQDSINSNFINFNLPFNYKTVALVGDSFGAYSTKFILENKHVIKFEWKNEYKNFKLFDYLDKSNIEVIHDPDKNVCTCNKVDLLIIECSESEQRTLSLFLIFKDVVEEGGKLFIIDSPRHQNVYIKERIKDKNYELIEYETFFEVNLKQQNIVNEEN